MPFSFAVDHDKARVEILAEGKTDFDGFVQLMQKLVNTDDYQPHFAIVADFSRVTYVPSFMEIRQFGKLFQTVSTAFRGKVAFVVRDTAQFRAGQFASAIARTLRFQMNVYRDRQSAMAWIQDRQESMMESLQQKIMEIISPFQLASLATVQTDGTPWVRYVTTRGDDQFKIRFATPLHSRKVNQIEANPKVHVTCGCTNLTTATAWVQISGAAVVKTGDADKKAFWNDFLKAYFTGPDDTEYAVVEVTPERIEYFTMERLTPEVLHF